MLEIPGDVPLLTPADITQVVNAHLDAPAFTIVPSADERGSNTILCSPPDLGPLRFGSDSFWPHLAAARACGVTPTVVRNHAIGLDVDEPADLARFVSIPSGTRSFRLLDRCRAEWEPGLALSADLQ
jgi:2-phospho-L-lactate guanylyltransferase